MEDQVGVGAAVLLLLSAVEPTQEAPSEEVAQFNLSKSYTVWAQGYGRCVYVVNDIYVERADLKQALMAYEHKERELEYLVGMNTSINCIKYFEKAAIKVGFAHHRTRLATQADREANLPPDTPAP